MIRRAALVVALFSALPALAQIYSWKDKDGRIHYGDTPPPTGEINVIQRGPAPRPAPPAAAPEAATAGGEAKAEDPARAPTLTEREQAFRERRAAAAEAEAKAAEEAAREAERERFCEQARNQLAALESGQRVSRFNAAGERELLDDATRGAEAARLRQQIAEHCQ
ncbi:MAG: DUF4124 domain-containing protein [Thauera sp.]